MSAAELAFFDGDHCQHVAARDEAARLSRKHAESLQVLNLRAGSPLRSNHHQSDVGNLPLFEPTLI